MRMAAVAPLILVACAPATSTPQAQVPQTKPTPSTSYGSSPFCLEASNVLNFRPEPTADPQQTASFARQQAKGWEELADKSPSEYQASFLSVSKALRVAAETYEDASLQGLKASEASLIAAREASLQLANAWDTATQSIEQECGWPATEGDRLDLPTDANNARSDTRTIS